MTKPDFRRHYEGLNSPKKSVTLIDRDIRDLMSKVNKASPDSATKKNELLTQIDLLKRERYDTIRPITYCRMLLSLV